MAEGLKITELKPQKTFSEAAKENAQLPLAFYDNSNGRMGVSSIKSYTDILLATERNERESKDNDLQAKVVEIESAINLEVMTDMDIASDGNSVDITNFYQNLKTKEPSQSTIILPTVNSFTAGIMDTAMYVAFEQYAIDINEIKSIIAGMPRIVVATGLGNPPSQQQITNAFKAIYSGDINPGDKLLVADVNTLWIMDNAGKWIEIKGQDIGLASQSRPGLAKHSDIDGCIGYYVEGVGQVNGWSDLKAAVADNTANIANKQNKLNGQNTDIVRGDASMASLIARQVSGTITVEVNDTVLALTSNATLNNGSYDGQQLAIYNKGSRVFLTVSSYAAGNSSTNPSKKEIELKCGFVHLVWDSTFDCWKDMIVDDYVSIQTPLDNTDRFSGAINQKLIFWISEIAAKINGLLTQIGRKLTVPGGTITQYLRGDGTLANFPSIPTGTNQQANLGSTTAANSITASEIGVKGTLPIANGGTGQTSLANITDGLGTWIIKQMSSANSNIPSSNLFNTNLRYNSALKLALLTLDFQNTNLIPGNTEVLKFSNPPLGPKSYLVNTVLVNTLDVTRSTIVYLQTDSLNLTSLNEIPAGRWRGQLIWSY